ncbi:VWA domain-containing protein [Solwaraspora sp. WMMD791]|uniref:VWA domain-containing protein n=1 Tax=Solwaraspora sp. WMMD791 TaxID=3016086 RepID=UPI00249B3C9A|nr:VWA domain-containing protein [Solwaraspora sp. WMMD791]WFE26338.1 VWA domain-containing protein [Solwaraspora sp. WMMD791]
MSSTGEHGQPKVVIAVWPCDRLDDEAERSAGHESHLELAVEYGWHILDEITIPLCPLSVPHDGHRALVEAALSRVEEVLQAGGGRRLLLFGPPEPSRFPDGWQNFLTDILLNLNLDRSHSLIRVLELLLSPDPRRATGSEVDFLVEEFDAEEVEYGGRLQHDSVGVHTYRLVESFDGWVAEAVSAGASAVPAGHAWGLDDVPPPLVPARTGPLPHDGLFVRRNNAFGTRPTLGIADLIDQGVLIDQTRIRFDDFVASNTDGIPLPGPGSAVAVSHGSTAVSGPFRTHDDTTHLVEIALRAGSQAPADQLAGESTGEPLSVNFVFAVDVSWSMSGEKLGDAIIAIRELYAQLRDTDVLGIIVFNDQARTLLRATRKDELSDDQLGQILAGMHADGGTDLNLGLSFAFDEIQRHSALGTVNCVYLFSDGDPTSGETNWVTIRANVAARVRGDVTLSCFGFGSDARVAELRALAGVSGGHWTFVTEATDVTSVLSEDLARRDSLAAINIQLRIDIPPQTTVWHIYGHDLITDPAGRAAVLTEAESARQRSRDEYQVENLPDLIRDERGIRIFAPDLAYGETYWVVVELQVPADAAADGAFGRATVQYLDTLARDNRRVEIELSAAGGIPTETVLTHGLGLRTSEVTFLALDDLYDDDKEAATRRLHQHAQTLKVAFATVPSPQFRDDEITLAKLTSLAMNLGTQRTSFEGAAVRGGAFGYAVYQMNQFGRVRGGYLSHRGAATR